MKLWKKFKKCKINFWTPGSKFFFWNIFEKHKKLFLFLRATFKLQKYISEALTANILISVKTLKANRVIFSKPLKQVFGSEIRFSSSESKCLALQSILKPWEQTFSSEINFWNRKIIFSLKFVFEPLKQFLALKFVFESPESNLSFDFTNF